MHIAPVHLSASQQRGPLTKGNEPAHIRSVKILHNIPTRSIFKLLFVMASSTYSSTDPDSRHEASSEISMYGSTDSQHEASPVHMPTPGVCHCGNQLAHWDWAGRPHPNLPAWCRPAIGNEDATPFQMASDIAVNDGKLSVQLSK